MPAGPDAAVAASAPAELERFATAPLTWTQSDHDTDVAIGRFYPALHE